MDLQQMINYVLRYTNNFAPNTRKYAYSQKVTTIFPANIFIMYPGKKQSGDYLVRFTNNCFTNAPIEHTHIVKELYDMVLTNPNLIDDYYAFVIDVANNWEHINLQNHPNVYFNNFTNGEMVELMCYISAQEEINYPSSNGFDGYKRPFYSYLEGIYAAIAGPTFTLQAAIVRCNAKVRFQSLPNTSIPYHLI